MLETCKIRWIKMVVGMVKKKKERFKACFNVVKERTRAGNVKGKGMYGRWWRLAGHVGGGGWRGRWF
jgi:muconolactone delta-isomerase